MTKHRNQSRQKKILPVMAGLATGAMLSAIRPEKRKKLQERGLIRPVTQQPLQVPGVERKIAAALQSAESRMIPAPVSAGFLMRGPNMQFGSAPPRGSSTGLRLTGRQILCGVRTDNTTAGKVLQPLGTGTSSQYSLTFDPDDVKTMPPPILELAAVFGRYCLRRCRVVYTPQCATSQTGSIALGVITDAGLAATGGPYDPTIGPTSVMNVMENSNSATGPPWSMFSLEVPCDETLRYTYQSTADGSLSTAEERQDHPFVLVASQGGIGTAISLGYIHVEYVIDFYELYNGTNEQTLRRLERRLEVVRSRLSCVGRLEVKSPAREETKGTVPSPEDQARLGLSGGCTRCHPGFPCGDHVWMLRPPSFPLSGVRSEDYVHVMSDSKPLVQEAGSVKSRSLKA